MKNSYVGLNPDLEPIGHCVNWLKQAAADIKWDVLSINADSQLVT